MAERTLTAITEIPPGEERNFEVDGVAIAVFHTRDGGVFATQAACPHKSGPLADRLTDQATVICPLHDRAYDLRTGVSVTAIVGSKCIPCGSRPTER